jgi:hypothetical protein
MTAMGAKLPFCVWPHNGSFVPDQDFCATGGKVCCQEWGLEPAMTNLGAMLPITVAVFGPGSGPESES